MTSLLFIHSPLVGPSSLKRLADIAEARGLRACLPDLTGIGHASSTGWSDYIDPAVTAGLELDDDVVVVGHSGAGVFLPLIGERLGKSLDALLFLDAVVPPESGRYRTPESMKALLDEQTNAGRMRKWIDWWPETVVDRLLPNEEVRAALSADMPELPRSLYDLEVAMPPGWSDFNSSYLRLSGSYDEDLKQAIGRGWQTGSIDGTHLSMVTDPDRIMREMEMLLGRD